MDEDQIHELEIATLSKKRSLRKRLSASIVEIVDVITDWIAFITLAAIGVIDEISCPSSDLEDALREDQFIKVILGMRLMYWLLIGSTFGTIFVALSLYRTCKETDDNALATEVKHRKYSAWSLLLEDFPSFVVCYTIILLKTTHGISFSNSIPFLISLISTVISLIKKVYSAWKNRNNIAGGTCLCVLVFIVVGLMVFVGGVVVFISSNLNGSGSRAAVAVNYNIEFYQSGNSLNNGTFSGRCASSVCNCAINKDVIADETAYNSLFNIPAGSVNGSHIIDFDTGFNPFSSVNGTVQISNISTIEWNFAGQSSYSSDPRLKYESETTMASVERIIIDRQDLYLIVYPEGILVSNPFDGTNKDLCVGCEGAIGKMKFGERSKKTVKNMFSFFNFKTFPSPSNCDEMNNGNTNAYSARVTISYNRCHVPE